MPKKWSHIACFDYFDTKPRNVRWSWSGRSADGKTVAVTLWQDRFEDSGMTYRSRIHAGDDQWLNSPGHSELLDNLEWALKHCSGEVRIILARPLDPKAQPRSIESCFPHPKMRMRVVGLDRATGQFVLQQIQP